MDWMRYITAAFILPFLFACSDFHEGVDDHNAGLKIAVPVKSGEWTERTYRILNFHGAYGTNIYKFIDSDTFYWKNESDEELTPCVLDNDGNFVQDKNIINLNASARSVIVMVSPGKENGEMGSYSFIPMSQSLYMTNPQSVMIGNYGLITFNTALIDRRIKLKVNFYKDAGVDVDDFIITDLTVVGGGNLTSGVTYYPATRQTLPLDPAAGLSFSLTEATAGEKDESGNELLFYSDGENMLASGFYAPRTTVASSLGCSDYVANVKEGGDYLYLTCKMIQRSQQADLRIALTSDTYPELLPQNYYEVNVIVRSNYINVNMDVYNIDNDWEQTGSGDNFIQEPDKIYLDDIKINGWTSVDPGNQEIK